MSSLAFDDDPLESLASCELYCGAYNTWDASILLYDTYHRIDPIERGNTHSAIL